MAKSVHDYDWQRLIDSGQLKKLRVPELNKYLVHHKLSSQGKKAEKLKRITWHVLDSEARSLSDKDENVEGAGEQTEESSSESDSEYDSEDDIVLHVQGQNTDFEPDIETDSSDTDDI